MASLVLTVIGPDRPGLVDALARHVADQDASWLESRLAHLGGQFAGMLHVEVPDERVESFEASMQQLEQNGLRCLIARSERHARAERVVRLQVVGNDRVGIVRDVARVLAECSVNVEELTTDYESAPMAGIPLFRATATLSVPTGLTTSDIEARIEQIANDIMVDVIQDD